MPAHLSAVTIAATPTGVQAAASVTGSGVTRVEWTVDGKLYRNDDLNVPYNLTYGPPIPVGQTHTSPSGQVFNLKRGEHVVVSAKMIGAAQQCVMSKTALIPTGVPDPDPDPDPPPPPPPPPPPGSYPRNQNQAGLRRLGLNPSGGLLPRVISGSPTYEGINVDPGQLTLNGGTLILKKSRVHSGFLREGSGTVILEDCDIYGKAPDMPAYQVWPAAIATRAFRCVFDGMRFGGNRSGGDGQGSDAVELTSDVFYAEDCWMRCIEANSADHIDVFQNNNGSTSNRKVDLVRCALIGGEGDARLEDITICKANEHSRWEFHDQCIITNGGTMNLTDCFTAGGNTHINNAGTNLRLVRHHFAPGWCRRPFGGVSSATGCMIAPQSRRPDGSVGSFSIWRFNSPEGTDQNLGTFTAGQAINKGSVLLP